MPDGARTFSDPQTGDLIIDDGSPRLAPASAGGHFDNLTGALLMMASMACFVFNDTLMKAMAGQIPLFQLMFLRGVLTTVAVAVIAWRKITMWKFSVRFHLRWLFANRLMRASRQ